MRIVKRQPEDEMQKCEIISERALSQSISGQKIGAEELRTYG
jgi:hypothetical protein